MCIKQHNINIISLSIAPTEKNTWHYGHHVFGDFVTMQLTFLDADIAEKVKQLVCVILDSAAQQSPLNMNYTW